VLIISQNAKNFGIPFPDDTIFRINLAWVNSLSELTELLEKHHENKIFLDLPVGRIKPPNNKYTLEELVPIIQNYKNIKYFAVSNIENKHDLSPYMKIMSKDITIVPKIESPKGVLNIEEIVSNITSSEKIIMLDHDDLYSNLLKSNEESSNFSDYILKLKNFCEQNNVIMLRTIGVIFSDEEKRTTEYVG
jgi:citrate lyase beta subunit